MAILDPTRNRCSRTRRASALGLAAALFITLPLGGSRPVASAQDAGKTAQSEAPLRKMALQLLSKARQAMREKRFDDAHRLASEVLEVDPADESAAAVRDKAVAGKLKEKVSLDFADTPVRDIVAYLADVSGIDMIVDPDVTEANSAEVTLKVEGMPLETALDIIVRRFAKLDYFVLDGCIYVSYERDLIVYGLLKYDVRDLVSGTADSRLDRKGDTSASARAASLVRLVMTFIQPESWRHASVSEDGQGGDAIVETPDTREGPGGGMVFRDGELIVRQTQAVHDEIARFLDMLRQHRRAPAARPRASESSEPTNKEARLSAQAWQAILGKRFEDAHRIASEILEIDPQDVLAKIVRDRAADERPPDKVSRFKQQVWSKLRLYLERPPRRKGPPADRPTPRGPGLVRDTPEITEIKEKLEQEISREFPDTHVADIVAYLHDVSGINMMLDPDAIEGEPKISVKAEGTRVRALLHAILRGVHLDYVVCDDGGLFISSEEGLSELVLRSYDVRNIVAKPKSGGGIEQRAVDLLALVTTVVGRGSWRHAFVSGAGGGGDLEIGLAGENEEVSAGIAFREGVLIVWQTPKLHAEIDRLLAQLRGGSGRGAAYAFLAFGPVVERSVGGTRAEATFIDFDTGRLHAPPPDLDPNDVEAVQAWGRKRRVDAMAEAGYRAPGLVCSDMLVLPIRPREWHALASAGLRRCWRAAGSEPRRARIRGSSDQDVAATYAFRTREGGVGVLQTVGFADGDPGGMKIRYKMLKWQLWATAGHNLLANPGFEDGDSLPTHWEPFDYSNRVLSCRDTLVKRSGAASLRLERAEGRFAPIDNVSQEIRSVLPGGQLSVGAYVRAERVENALIDLAFLNDAGECIKHDRVGDVIRGTHDWRKYCEVFTVPASAVDALVCLETGGAGTVWFDDLAASLAE